MTKEQIVAKLEEARARIEKGWCQHVYALGPEGKGISARSPRASAWCPDGALFSRDTESGTEAYVYFARAVHEANPGWSIWEWNDAPERTKEQVLAMFERAKALVFEEEILVTPLDEQTAQHIAASATIEGLTPRVWGAP